MLNQPVFYTHFLENRMEQGQIIRDIERNALQADFHLHINKQKAYLVLSREDFQLLVGLFQNLLGRKNLFPEISLQWLVAAFLDVRIQGRRIQ